MVSVSVAPNSLLLWAHQYNTGTKVPSLPKELEHDGTVSKGVSLFCTHAFVDWVISLYIEALVLVPTLVFTSEDN